MSTNSPRTAALSKMNFCSVSGWALAPRVMLILLSDLGELCLEQLRALHVVDRAALQRRDFFRRQRAHGLGRRADDQHVVVEMLVLRDQRAGADQAALADAGAVENHGLDADQRAVADGAAVQHGLVA